MQSRQELIEIILAGNKTVSHRTAEIWAKYLSQLKGCRLFSVAAQEVDPEGWLRARTNGIGGSDIAAIIGENPWSSPRKIWMSKLNMFGADKPAEQAEPARWGNLLESTIAEEWARRTGRKWIHIPVTLQSEENPWMLANVDGFTLTDDGEHIYGILEIKTTTAHNEDTWKNGPIPFYYMCQTNWYCGICQLPVYDIVCLVGGQHLYYYSVPADADLFKRETEAASDFWNNNVLKGIEPAATDTDVESLSKAEHDEEAEPAILTDEESTRLADAYCTIRDKISALDKVKKALYAQLYVCLGKSTAGIIGEHTVSIITKKTRKIDYNKLLNEFPEAYEACVDYTVSSSLNIK